MDLLIFVTMLTRYIYNELLEIIHEFPVLGIVGPRQVGKTTIAKLLVKDIKKDTVFLDLENPRDIAKLTDPMLFFENNQDKCIIIDEVQINKELFPIIRAVIDLNREPARFILLGSASPELIRDSSESLAGRIYYKELTPFHFDEVNTVVSYQKHWLNGGYPEALLTDSKSKSKRWRRSFIQTYIERDLPMLGLQSKTTDIQRLFRMISHLHGQQLNYQLLSKSLGLSGPTIKKQIDFLEHAYIVRLLEPYYYNTSKRLVKSPKIYVRDTGLLHSLLEVDEIDQLFGNPVIGNSWEGYVVEQIYAVLPDGCSLNYYRTQQGAELDLIICRNLIPLIALEIKFNSNPKISHGNEISLQDLGINKCFVVVPETDSYFLKPNIEVVSLSSILSIVKSI
jgi:predicted AAA+ superfamily ATPase